MIHVISAARHCILPQERGVLRKTWKFRKFEQVLLWSVTPCDDKGLPCAVWSGHMGTCRNGRWLVCCALLLHSGAV